MRTTFYRGDIVETQGARAALDTALSDLCRSFNAGTFTPILESDVAAFLYHRLVTNGVPSNEVYLASRVCGEAARSRKPDIVLGSLKTPQACIEPALICELKVFQRWGHSDQQMRHRFMGILDEDLRSLEQMRAFLETGRVEIVADFHLRARQGGYMSGTWNGSRRIDVVAERCREIGADLFWIRPAGSDEVELTLVT